MTSSKRWQEIDRIFAAALEREPGARSTFLAEACGDDEQLRAEVESLMAHDIPESLVGNSAVQEATRLLEKRVAEPTIVQVGRYRIIRVLGSGGMGRVYLGQDEQLNRQVAVKLLAKYDASEAERMRRFRQEALAASALNHPNILTIYEIGEFENTNFITAEFVDGLTLRARMKEGALPPELALDIAIQIASALSSAHAAGIIHRDIKPENVMVRADGLVKVLDFGIAKFTQTEDTENVDLVETRAGAIIGTAAYMSPEQARGTSIDSRSDIWSLGVVLYEMVARRLPFWGKTPADVIAAVIERNPPPLPTDGSVALESLERIVFKALQKEKENRYQTAAELLTDLKQLKQKVEQDRSDSPKSSALPGEVVRAPLEPKTISAPPVSTGREAGTTRSSAEPIVSRIKRPKYAVVILLTLVAAAGFFTYRSLLTNKAQQIESIAVMPFTNESGNGDLEYLSDGMTDSLINSLSQLPNLAVKARSSVFHYKSQAAEPQRIAAELSVQAILSGRVVQRGDDLTLYLSLIEARTGNQLWGEQYDRKLTDIVALQKEIALDVSNKLRVKLSGAEQQKVAKNYTTNAEAYQLYLKGRYHVIKLTPAEVQKGISYFQQAIEIDPNYPLAYAGLSEAYRSLAIAGDLPPTEFLPKAKEAAQKAIDLDDTLAEAHTALGVAIYWGDWNWSAAEKQYKRALELNPKSAEAYLYNAHLLSNTGRHPEALAEAKRARDLDPQDLRINALEGLFLIHAGKSDEALARLQKTFELDPNYWLAHSFAASAYIEKGMFTEAVAEARRARELFDGSSQPIAFQGYALAKSGKQAEARALLEDLLTLSTERYVTSYHIALVYNGLNERDKTLAWLERAYQERNPRMAFLKVEPKWNNLRGDPRFQDLLRRVGF
ncbi:MAG: protein kinase [Pyrinomonadaceae bacterium]|nr:protein kinase [Pyrinomonadaceae bacterium]